MGFFKRFTKPKATISITIPSRSVELGAKMESSITVASAEEFDATEIRMELRCIEKRRRERWVYNKQRKRNVRRIYWDVATLHSDNTKASGKLHLVPSLTKTFPLKIDIPAGGRESFDGLDANVSWSVKGVLAIKGRPDITSETIELQVISPLKSHIEKERKVKMTPCEYCGTPIPETATSCSYCGAPRRA